MRRFSYPPTATAGPLVQQSAGNSSSSNAPHIPGVYPPSSLANDLLARERERLERLGKSEFSVIAFFKKFSFTLQERNLLLSSIPFIEHRDDDKYRVWQKYYPYNGKTLVATVSSS